MGGVTDFLVGAYRSNKQGNANAANTERKTQQLQKEYDAEPTHYKTTAPWSSGSQQRRNAAQPDQTPTTPTVDPVKANQNRANRAANTLGDGMLGGARDALRNTPGRRMREAGLE